MISDPLWFEYLALSECIDSEWYGDHNIRLMSSDKPFGVFIYPFRMFIYLNDNGFPPKAEPDLSLNLELGEFGTCSLGGHDSEGHNNYGPASPNMSIDEFKVWAFETAKRYLTL